MTSQQLGRVVQAEFRRQQLTLDKEALAVIVDYVAQAGTGVESVYALIDKLDTGAHADDAAVAAHGWLPG